MKLSLAGWSLHKLFRAAKNPLKLLDFPGTVAERFGLDAVELNSPFFVSREPKYLRELAQSAERAGVRLLNIAVDEVGDLSADNDADRARAVSTYSRWIPVAAELGCAAIRANTGGMGVHDVTRALAACIDSFRRLADLGVQHGVAILVENHGGLSAKPDLILKIIDSVYATHGPNAVGTLPDFGNWTDSIDRIESLKLILPLAKAVHAKVLDIDENLDHPRFDLHACMTLVRQCGYDGYVGIEYEGNADPIEGVKRAIKKLTPLLSG
ncbi:MAG: sugar phosphate isomerase/epimerase family protein [Tepidisphaeraceae bacterium]